MPGAKDGYFIEVGRHAQRKAEMDAFYLQTTILGPLLEEMTVLRGALIPLCASLERIALAIETRVSTPVMKAEEPTETVDAPAPEYVDEEKEWLREQIRQSGKMTPALAELLGEEEESQNGA